MLIILFTDIMQIDLGDALAIIKWSNFLIHPCVIQIDLRE